MKTKRIMLDGQEYQISCIHKKTFPPMCTHPKIIEEEGTPLERYKSGDLSSELFNRFTVWEKVCGLREMGNKCISCDNCRLLDSHPIYGTKEKRVPSFWAQLKAFKDGES